MGCLTANIRRATSPLKPSITKSEDLRGSALRYGDTLNADIAVLLSLSGGTARHGEMLRAKVGLVCSIPEELAIRFAKDKLVWEGDTNNEGVILYNTLIATGEWSLEEITIEELL